MKIIIKKKSIKTLENKNWLKERKRKEMGIHGKKEKQNKNQNYTQLN